MEVGRQMSPDAGAFVAPRGNPTRVRQPTVENTKRHKITLNLELVWIYFQGETTGIN